MSRQSHTASGEQSVLPEQANGSPLPLRDQVSRSSSRNSNRSGFIEFIRTRILFNNLQRLQRSIWLCTIPLVMLLIITGSDFLILTNLADSARSLFFAELPVPYDDERRDPAENFKADILQYVYLALLLVCALQWRKITGYLYQWPHLVLLWVYLFAGVIFSIDPVKILTNSTLIVIGYLAAVLFASATSKPGNYNTFYLVVFWPMFVIHAASLYILTLYDINVIDFLESTQRYGGLAGNPNSLGSTAVLGVWAASCMLLSVNSTVLVRVISCIGLVVFLFNTELSGSGTSKAAIFMVLIALIWLRLLSGFESKTRVIINGSLLLATFFGVLYMFVVTTPADLFLSITGSMGKDATLSGRTELWAVARDAISVKPVFGWGLDSHQSVMDQRAFFVPFNHYHNGFLDTMIAGGVILLALVLYNFYKFCQAFFNKFRLESSVFPLLLPLIILVVLNISEYSLLRPNSQLWLVYTVAFTMLTYSADSRLDFKLKFGGKSRRHSGRRKRGQKLRWA